MRATDMYLNVYQNRVLLLGKIITPGMHYWVPRYEYMSYSCSYYWWYRVVGS